MLILDETRYEALIFFATLLTLLVVYRTFIPDLFRFLIDHGVQAIILILFYALIYGQIGTGLGLPLLFWSEEPLTRWSVAFCSTLLLTVIGVNGYYLLDDQKFGAVMKRVFDFLGEESELPTASPGLPVNALLRPLNAIRPPGRVNRVLSGLKWIARLPFLDFCLNPSEPDRGQPFSNPYQLSRFLRLVRLPFLVMLALPAFLPRFFVNLPRFAPVVQNIQKRQFFGEHNKLLGLFSLENIAWPDVVLDRPAYWYALLVWLFGLWCGVIFVKLFLLASTSSLRGQGIGSGPSCSTSWQRALSSASWRTRQSMMVSGFATTSPCLAVIKESPRVWRSSH